MIHFVGLKAVGDSVKYPLSYWYVNLFGTHRLLSAMDQHHRRTLVSSSSAILFGYPDQVPIPETASVQTINPYGVSKHAVEALLSDVTGARQP